MGPEVYYQCACKYHSTFYDDVIKWKHFPRYWPFVRGIHRAPVNSPHKGQWRGALMFSLLCTGINGWVNNGKAGDMRRHHVHYDVIVMLQSWAIRCSKNALIRQHLIIKFNQPHGIIRNDSINLATSWSTSRFQLMHCPLGNASVIFN